MKRQLVSRMGKSRGGRFIPASLDRYRTKSQGNGVEKENRKREWPGGRKDLNAEGKVPTSPTPRVTGMQQSGVTPLEFHLRVRSPKGQLHTHTHTHLLGKPASPGQSPGRRPVFQLRSRPHHMQRERASLPLGPWTKFIRIQVVHEPGCEKHYFYFHQCQERLTKEAELSGRSSRTIPAPRTPPSLSEETTSPSSKRSTQSKLLRKRRIKSRNIHTGKIFFSP